MTSLEKGLREFAAKSDWQPGQVLLDDFVVESLLGEGGMGKVYLVRSRSSRLAFAVKRAKGLGDVERRNFLAELQTWIGLPEHSNLVPCRFFRTLGEEVLIFAEYVEGGSLSEWIRGRKLYEGSPKAALERVLDVAIQVAWGLHCLHELGLVHQDVKPGNVLMAGEPRAAVQGVKAKLSDYGLARAKAAGWERYVPELGRSILFSSGGLTPAYCSPEQANGLPVTRKTDIWSWGVSVLEMFAGDVTWRSGQMGAEVLEDYLREHENDGVITEMPDGVVEVLRVCFRGEPAQRWESLAEVVDRLKAVFHETAGVRYGRVLDAIERRIVSQTKIKERRTRYGVPWIDPRKWLEQAWRAEGKDPAEVVALVSKFGGSRRGELVADLAMYDEARRVVERLVEGGRKELEAGFAALCIDKAFVHEMADDAPGALREYDRAIEIYERLTYREGRRELANRLALAYLNKANAVKALGDLRAAVGLQDRAIEIRERLVHQEGQPELANDLALIYLNKANAVSSLGDTRAALGLYDRAVEIWERLVNQEGRRELASDLAMAYQNKAVTVGGLGDNPAAVELYDRTIAIYDRLIHQEGQRELANDLARTYINKALAATGLGDIRAAVGLCDRAIEIRQRLVYQEERWEFAIGLAEAYMNKGNALSGLGDNRAAVGLYDRAIEIQERLAHQEGRRELVGDLAWVKALRAGTLLDIGEVGKGTEEGREVAEVLRAEVARTGRAGLEQVLNWLTAKLDAVR